LRAFCKESLKRKTNQIKIEGGCREKFAYETCCFTLVLGMTGVVAAEPKIVGKTVEYSAQECWWFMGGGD
jgi:hypothetical protein